MANPFADPASRLDENPFDDPAIRNASRSLNNYSTDNLEEDLQASTQPQQQAQRTDDTASRLEEIRKREAELAERERNIGQREERVRRFGANNWPPFYPLIYHDIATEIPTGPSKMVVLTLYRIWLLLLIVLVLNLVGCILLLVSGQDDGAKDLGAGIMYCPVIAITSFLLWYRPIYNAFMKEHALFYYLFFLFGGFHIAFVAYMVVGIPGTGSAGLINTIHAFATGSIVTGVFGVLASVGWVMQFLGMLFEYRAIWAHHNDKGHTFEQAKSEVAIHGLSAYFTRGSQV